MRETDLSPGSRWGARSGRRATGQREAPAGRRRQHLRRLVLPSPADSPIPGARRRQAGSGLGPETPVISRGKPGIGGTDSRGRIVPICREIHCMHRVRRTACHAEGRGFESHQPLRKGLHLQAFFVHAVGWCVCPFDTDSPIAGRGGRWKRSEAASLQSVPSNPAPRPSAFVHSWGSSPLLDLTRITPIG